jgi:hypothetical protein
MKFGADTVALFTRVTEGGKIGSCGSVRNDLRHGVKTSMFLNANTSRLKRKRLRERNPMLWRMIESRWTRFCHAEVETSKAEKIMLRLCIATAEQGR